jgi:recombination protein RecT
MSDKALEKLKEAKLTIGSVLEERKDKILKMGGFSETEVEQFIATAVTSISMNPKLAQCTLESLVSSLYDAARCGLTINSITQEGHLIPFRDKCTFVVGYRGLLKLVKASGSFAGVSVKAVFDKDEFFMKQGLHPDIHHIPVEKDKGNLRGVYAVLYLHGAQPVFEYVSLEDGEKHRDRFCNSKKNGKIFGPWVDHFEAMMMKTALRKLVKYTPTAPATSKLHEAVRYDEWQANSKDPMDWKVGDVTDIQEPKPLVDEATGEEIPPEVAQ